MVRKVCLLEITAGKYRFSSRPGIFKITQISLRGINSFYIEKHLKIPNTSYQSVYYSSPAVNGHCLSFSYLCRVKASPSVEGSTMFTAHSRATSRSLITWRVWRLRRRSTRSNGFLSRTPPTSYSPQMVSDWLMPLLVWTAQVSKWPKSSSVKVLLITPSQGTQMHKWYEKRDIFLQSKMKLIL